MSTGGGGLLSAKTAEIAERLAVTLMDGDMQPTTARVWTALIFTNRPSVTMSELGQQLHATVGTVSGAIRTLRLMGLVEQVYVTGSRQDHYRASNDGWARMFYTRSVTFQRFLEVAQAGLRLTPEGGRAYRRLAEMNDFYLFMGREVPKLVERWWSGQR